MMNFEPTKPWAGTQGRPRDPACKAMFVSHQWVNRHHPDPEAQQFRVLQEALKHLQNGCEITVDDTEISGGSTRMSSQISQHFRSSTVFLWYDFFSCPQRELNASSQKLHEAIESIPFYMERCHIFAVLCPTLAVCDREVLNYHTWQARLGRQSLL